MKLRLIPTIAAIVIACSFVGEATSAALTPIKYEKHINAATENSLIPDSYIVQFRTPGQGIAPFILPAKKINPNSKSQVPFGEHNNGQSKVALEAALGVSGKISRIFDQINAVHVQMTADEADRLRRNPLVESIHQSVSIQTAVTQFNPGWALDRLNTGAPSLDNTYSYTNTGAGQTIYILDSGLNMTHSSVQAEFGSRATMFYDFNPNQNGADCNGHGSSVASAAGGNTFGVAKGANLNIVKITQGCTRNSNSDDSVAAFNWLASNAPPGTIVNWSHGFSAPYYTNTNGDYVFTCGGSIIYPPLEAAITAAHNAGIIVVVAAGNDACNTADYTPTRIPEAFVVGATQNSVISGTDSLAQFLGDFGTGNGGTRVGTNISGFAPGKGLPLLAHLDGQYFPNREGTSFAAPYVAGVFAVACQAAGTLCSTSGSAASLYAALRSTGYLNSVVNPNGTPMTSSPSRFIWQQW